MQYVISWVIEIEADTPKEAALLAADFQVSQNEGRPTGAFTLMDEHGRFIDIDLNEES